MPSLGADMTEGTITKWLVKPGDHVNRGDIVAEIETDKSDMEVEIFASGVITELVVPQGETVPVGAVLALLAVAGAGQAAPEAPRAAPPPAPEPAKPVAAAKPAAAPRATPTARVLAGKLGVDLDGIHGTGLKGTITRADIEHAAQKRAATREEKPVEGRRLLVSPRARKLADERGIDLATVSGTGPGGSITAADLDRAVPTGRAEAPPPRAPAPKPVPGGQRVVQRGPIAALMARSNSEIPHYYLGIDINMERALAWLAAENKRRPVTERLLYSALLMKATALAAHEVPEMNGYFAEGALHINEAVNLGVAISLREGGLVAPAILDASSRTVTDIMRTLMDLVKRARSGKLRASEMSSGTITVTNLGELGVDYVYGVIYPPQVALVGFGRIQDRPWAEGGMLGVKPVLRATLAGDHRASDGHRGGIFLATIDRLLQEPEHL